MRAIEDLDIVPNPDPANLDRLCQTLETLEATLLLNPARRFGAREGWLLRRGSNVSLATSLGDLDVIRMLPEVPEWSPEGSRPRPGVPTPGPEQETVRR